MTKLFSKKTFIYILDSITKQNNGLRQKLRQFSKTQKILYFANVSPWYDMKKALVLLPLFYVFSAGAQHTSNLQHTLQKGEMAITYDLTAPMAMRVKVYYRLAADSLLQVPDDQLQGGAGIYITPGQDKQIRWTMENLDSLERRQIKIRLETKPFIDMVKVKGGTFRMGCTQEQRKCGGDEKPVHKVRLDDYAISRYEITNAQYAVFLNQQEVDRDGRDGRTALIHIDNKFCHIRYQDGQFIAEQGRKDHPVVEVTWNGAQAFCQWAGGRLPTEAEWEYASRGGQQGRPTLYSGSNHVDSVAWYDRNAEGSTHPVGTKKPNELGIYNMSGNVWEWCFDWYSDYPKARRTNPKGPRRGENVVVRGGSWLYYGSFCRVANRGSSAPSYAFNNYGFRLVRKRE